MACAPVAHIEKELIMLVRNVLLVVLALCLNCASASAQELTKDKKADIERLLEMTGSLAMGKQMAKAVIAGLTESLRKSRPDIPAKLLDLIPAEVEAVFDENMASFKEEILPIYHKHFTAEELKGLIRFYSTDLGQKTIKVMPVLVQEGMIAGQRWGQSLGPQIERRIRERLGQQGVKV
jgi:hypothetical protein